MTPPREEGLAHKLPPLADSEAQIDQDAEHARRAVARHYPDDTDQGKAAWGQLGIEKGK